MGPMANPRMYIETTNDASSTFVDLKSFIRLGTPGANIEEASGLYDRYQRSPV